jgi:hypothetical protein
MLCLALTCGLPALVPAQDYMLKTDYENYWFSPSPTNGPYSNYFGIWPTEGLTNASTVLYCGQVVFRDKHSGPTDGDYSLDWSAFGHPVESIQSDLALGQQIVAPAGTDTNRPPANFIAVRCGDNTNAFYESPEGGAFWVPSTRQIIAAQPNNVAIDWVLTDGTTNRRVLNVDGVPAKRPAKLFWTESPYDAPAVNLQGFFPVIHYNAQVWKPVYEYATNISSGYTNVTTNILSGVWLDDQKQLHAKNVTGTFVLEYYETGMYSRQVQPKGIEVVQVLPPSLQIVDADVGARLMPVDLYWANMDTVNGVIPNVTQGMNDTAYVYTHTGPKNNWAFAIKRTWEEPWSLEIYWQHRGVMGVLWPYEQDWYSCDWPAYPQLFVLGDAASEQAPTLIPPALNAELQPDMEPELHAQLSTSGRSFRTTQPGTCLLKFTTADNIWFEVVQTVRHTNYFYFDREPREWTIGEELTPGQEQAWAMGFDGTMDYVSIGESFLNRQTNWTLSLWFKVADFRPATLYSEGNPAAAFALSVTTNGQLQAATWNKTLATEWTTATTTNTPLTINHWHYLTLTYAAGSDSNGTLRFYLDNHDPWETNGVPRVNFDGEPYAVIAATTGAPQPTNDFFYGKIDQLRIWRTALSSDQVRLSPDATLPETAGSLVADYPLSEGQGDVVHNAAGDKDGTAHSGAFWCYGRVVPGGQWSGFPGYIYLGTDAHAAQCDRYNVNRYAYPDETNPASASYVFAVNTGMLEVWWAHRSRQPGMPAVYYPSQVVCYTNVWPTNTSQIVIASGLGSRGDSLLSADDALSFANRSGAHVLVPNNAVLEVGNQLTVEAWVRLTGSTNDWTAVSRARSTPYWNGFSLGGSNDMMRVSVWNNATSSNQYTLEAGSIPVEVWTHLAFTYEADGALIAYINGKAVGRSNVINSPVGAPIADLVIGRPSWSSLAPPFPGIIGEVRIWSLARSAAELLATRRARLMGVEAGLVAYYPFVHGADSSVLADAGPFSLQGTISGAAWTTPGRPVQVPGPLVFGSPSIYFQNDPEGYGYNPNEEHALMMGGVVYALRNDLNRFVSSTKTNTHSEPFVLLDYLDPGSGRPKMMPFSVVATNELYTFDRDLVAGTSIVPPMPLGAMPLCTNTSGNPKPPAWKDRKEAWWAIKAGDANMKFYYQMQPTFFFPDVAVSAQPAVGREVPWLPTPFTSPGTNGDPVTITYHISWPDPVAKLHLGQTLTKAAFGLPEIWNQLSIEVLYQQSSNSVTLFDPIVSHGSDLNSGVIDAMVSSQLARRDSAGPLIRFPNLPPSIYPRLYYDPNAEQLVLTGQYVETLTGGGYLLLNMLEDFEKAVVRDLGNGIDPVLRSYWTNAVNALSNSVTPIVTNVAYVRAALGAGLTNGTGYVTLVFNNSANSNQVPPASSVSLAVIAVDTNLYPGELEVIRPADVLAEQLSLRYGADLAGRVSECDFRWRWIEPTGGLIPNTDYEHWSTYGGDAAPGTNEVTIAGASPFTLSDHYFAAQYRPHATNGPSGTNWSVWSTNLAPGWVKRVMNGINPFVQMLPDKIGNPVDTRVTMVSQAGAPYEGDIALNTEAAGQAGLIATYETVFNRAMNFSLRANLSDASMNETLLYAASRLCDLYAVLGNEAYADAQDPTIAFPQELSAGTAGATATSIFPFMNQEPNLLEEELALLRGRDGTLDPPVTLSPVYNRLIWNFTAGINGGEPAYAFNYDIRGNPSNTVGTITAEDAKRLYPQGHGDAWGHYLCAIRHYYDLLSYTNFVWQTEPSATLVGNATVITDFFDEQKFAETAAARARVGAAIVRQTFRQRYSEEPTGRWAGYTDSNTNRAWGISEWASRAGQAAFYDWAVANSLMLDSLTNMTQVGGKDLPPEGIQNIDRASTPELGEITASLREIQSQVDSANGGLNPLGLARNVVPFDIDPAAIDAGKTHFEQIYDRALQALRNACVAFDQARGASLQLRKQFESVYSLQESLAQNETDFHNRLIQIYGYPYPDDIGPTGTYPQGYDGPDLINWQILDLEDLLVTAPTGQVMQVQIYNLTFTPSTNAFSTTNYADFNLVSDSSRDSNHVVTIEVQMADNGLKVKKPGWTGRRRAQGELQLALSDYVQTWYALEAKKDDYNRTLADLEWAIERLEAQYVRYPTEWDANRDIQEDRRDTAQILFGLKATKSSVDLIWRSLLDFGLIRAGNFPSVNTGFIGPFPNAWTGMEEASVLAKFASYAASVGPAWVSRGMDLGIDAQTMQQSLWEADLGDTMNDNNYRALLKGNTMDTLIQLQNQYIKQAELFAKVQALSQSYERIQKLLASGEQLIFQRGQVRSRAAQRIQMARYGDLAFRIFRDDTLRRYQQTFDLAARYTYLAAKAYDYETGLLYTDTARTPGSKFLEDVVRARAPGRFYVWLGEPMIGGSVGEPGLADILARMKADWSVVKGRFGFNNPQTETSRFSLRGELYRISPNAGDDTWAQQLENCKVDNLHDSPEFMRYCRPYTDTTNVEPGLVIPFSTYVVAGQNYFGHPLAGGDNAYDASHAATKVRSMGVWFSGYTNNFNTNTTGSGLANQPYVYLIPVGEDVLRSPTRNALQVRHWQVLDQAIPLPYNVGGADIDNPDWMPVIDSLREPMAQVRRFASFRAYHDSGGFNPAETCTNGRLVGRSVWNTRWLLIIPGRTLLSDPALGIERFIHGSFGGTNGVKDIKIFFQTYSIPGD